MAPGIEISISVEFQVSASFPHHTDGGLYQCALLLREEEESEEKKRDRKPPSPPYPNIGLSHVYNIGTGGGMSARLKNAEIH